MKIYEDCVAAARCVPLVKNEVTIKILETDGTETPITIDELRARNIEVKPVPRLAAKRPTINLSSGASLPPPSSEADALHSQVQVQV